MKKSGQLTQLPANVEIGGRISLDPNIINYFEADGNYTQVYLKSKEKYYVATTLGKIEKRLSSYGYFIRPRRGLLVNTNFVKSFSEHNIRLNNSVDIKIPRRKKTAIFNTLSNLG